MIKVTFGHKNTDTDDYLATEYQLENNWQTGLRLIAHFESFLRAHNYLDTDQVLIIQQKQNDNET